ncbi:MAG: hypothetical protein MJA82_06300 [Clostridia bacterium]|nr:hypothetical protein [Clostridia bacterium]
MLAFVQLIFTMIAILFVFNLITNIVFRFFAWALFILAILVIVKMIGTGTFVFN